MCHPEHVSAHVEPPVCVLGLGLIGGSLLRAAVAAGREAWGYNRSVSAVEQARADGFDASADLAEVLGKAQARRALVVVGVPMPAVDGVLAAVAEFAPGCPLTDVVSVKAPVSAAVAAHGLAARYVGGHPMAGTAESGWTASDANLFRDAVWVVATDNGVDPAIWSAVARLALACGSVVVPAESVEHDGAVARISHLPHLLAEALALSGAAGGDLALGLAAGSFRDGTRVAGSAPALVRAMCEANADALLAALDETLTVLSTARTALADFASTAELVEAGYDARLRYENVERWEITGIEPGSPDWVERLRDAGRRGGVLRAL
ncbi:prephenate dehydrogenase [Antrihabitans sp. YC2-6]|uniref:prephenate dehydrogenase n=1 Tax=Antrihabitans sp. YC2-6 TaxID=2799498 RepID=UPI0018F4D730|nr:prephenate dehydrogenase [Antrihabitans sp. YC2-6]MBJ8346167.1 prephenate dehydrogenase [Antrihabitans sp. YC2-6]